MLQLISRGQAAMWDAQSRITGKLRNEKGEANVFAVIILIIIVCIVAVVVAIALKGAADTMSKTVDSCITDPTKCAVTK